MGVCTSKKNTNFGRLGSDQSINTKSIQHANSNYFKIDLLQHQIKPPPNITSPTEDYSDSFGHLICSQKKKRNGIVDHFSTLANGTIKSELLICGYIRELLCSITKKKLIPLTILNSVKHTYFPSFIAIEIGASNQSFYSTFNISHQLSSSNAIHYNGPNDECYVSTIHNEVFCTDQEPRAFIKMKQFQQTQYTHHFIDIISHGTSNKHLFICTIDQNTSQQHVWAYGKNMFGQCGTGNENGLTQWSEINAFWRNTISNMNSKEQMLDIKCGQYHTLFLTQNGNVWSCGQNWNAQLGLKKEIRKQNEPQLLKFIQNNNDYLRQITPMSSDVNINIGYSAANVFITSVDNVINVSTEDIATENACVFEDSVRIKSISCGDSHNLCVDENGELWIFGHMAINNGMKEHVFEPIKHPYFAKANADQKRNDIRITKINSGTDHSVCCDSNGICYLFGTNDKGQVGTKYMDNQYEPHIFQNSKDDENKNKYIFEELNIVDVEAGQCHTVLLTSTNDLITFGSNHYRQCSTVVQKDIVFFGHILLRHEELGITSDTYIERIIASANSTIIIVNMSKRLKIVR